MSKTKTPPCPTCGMPAGRSIEPHLTAALTTALKHVPPDIRQKLESYLERVCDEMLIKMACDLDAKQETTNWLIPSEAKKSQSKRAHQKRRLLIIKNLDGRCRRCGLPDIRTLHVHHKHGGGAKERSSLGWRYHYHLARMPKEKLQKLYELLCANCHAIEHAEDA